MSPLHAFPALTTRTPDGDCRLIILEQDSIMQREFVGCVEESQMDQVLLGLEEGVSDLKVPVIQWYEKWEQQLTAITNSDLVEVLRSRMTYRAIEKTQAYTA